MKKELEKLIIDYVAAYPENKKTQTRWKRPIFGTADATHPQLLTLKKSVRQSHALPLDILGSAQSIIAYFLPFDESVAKSNRESYYASKEWASAYIETNTLIGALNAYIIEVLESKGYEAKAIPATHNFDEVTLMSDWSHRHLAAFAGIGKFGLNNMLITESGCAGRIGTIVSSVPLEPSPISAQENCLYYRDGSCGICIKKCPKEAFNEGYDRFKCYEILLENDSYHKDLGLVDVCGKCCVALPCTYKNPCK